MLAKVENRVDITGKKDGLCFTNLNKIRLGKLKVLKNLCKFNNLKVFQVSPKFFYLYKIYLVLQAFRQPYEISKCNIIHFLINKKYIVKMVFDTSLKFAKKLCYCVFKIALFLFVFQFAATVVDCQDGSLVSGLLSSLEQPPKQLVDSLGQPAPNGGIL